MLFKIIKDHKQAGSQLYWLSLLDLKKTYSGSALGWAWAVIKPSVMILVYWFVIGRGLRGSRLVHGVEFFPWLLVGMVAWLYMKDILNAGVKCFRTYSYLVSKVKFPVSTIPTFIATSTLFVHAILLTIALSILLLTGKSLPVQFVQLPLYTALMFIMMVSWSFIVGPISAISKDFASFVGTITQTLFWMSGVIFNINSLSDGIIKTILQLNPIYFIVEGYRKSILYGEWFYQDLGSMWRFLAVLALMIVVGLFIYKRAYNDMVDSL